MTSLYSVFAYVIYCFLFWAEDMDKHSPENNFDRNSNCWLPEGLSLSLYLATFPVHFFLFLLFV